MIDIDAIVARVAALPPDGIDKAELAADLEAAFSAYQKADELHRLGAWRKRKAKDLKLAEELVLRLGDFRYGREPVLNAQRIVRAICARKPSAWLHRVLGVEEGSALDNLVGRGLATIFQNHFQRRAGYTRDPYDDLIKGPFIDFAEVALAQLGIPHPRPAIARALDRGKHGRKKATAKTVKK